MTGIIPDPSSGGVIVRDINGNPVQQPGVLNVYRPPADFTMTCALNYLPSDCTARITPAQINAFQAEMLCFAVALDPEGTWDCASTCNLATAFQNWVAGNMVVDGVTIIGTGTTADPWKVSPEGVVDAICADDEAADALAACLIDGTSGNLLIQGEDGRLYVGVAGVIENICDDDAAASALAACLISTDLANQIEQGSDGRLYVPHAVAAICGDDDARQALAACLLSTDPNNGLALGAVDGLLFYDPCTQATRISECVISTDPGNGLVQGTDDLLFVPLDGTSIAVDQLAFISADPLTATHPATQIARADTTITNPHPTRPMNVNLLMRGYGLLRRFGNGFIIVFMDTSVDGGATWALVSSTTYRVTGAPDAQRLEASLPYTTHDQNYVIPPGGTINLSVRLRLQVAVAYGAGSGLSGELAVRGIGVTI